MATSRSKIPVQCPCGVAFAVSAERAGATVTCPNCTRTLVVPSRTRRSWYVSRDNKQKLGPYSSAQLKQMAAAGQLQPDDMLLREGQKKWVKAGTVRGLFPEPARPVPAPGRTSTTRSALPQPARRGAPWLVVGVAAVVLLAAGVSAGFFLATKLGFPPAGTAPLVANLDGGKQDTASTPADTAKEPDGSGEKPGEKPPPDPEPAKAPQPPQRALVLSYIPADVSAAVIVNPRQILQSPFVPALPPGAADEMLQELGVKPEQVEQVIVLLQRPSALPAGPSPPKDTWVLLESREGRFSLRFPVKPTQSERKTPLGTRQVFSVEADNGNMNFEISYVDFAKDSPFVGDQSRVDFAARGLEFKPGFKEKKEITLGKVPGAEVIIDDAQLKSYSVHRVYVAGDRLYHLEATTRKAQKPQKPPPEFARFFSSFSVTGADVSPPGAAPPLDLLPLPAAIIRFRDPVDGKQILGKLLKGVREAKHQDKLYYVGSEEEALFGQLPAGHAAADRTLLLAPEPLLHKMLTAAGATSPLLERLRQAEAGDDLTAVVFVEPYRKLLNTLAKPYQALLPPSLAAAAGLPDRLVCLTATVNLRGKTLARLTLEADGEPSAQAVENLIQSAHALVKKSFPDWEPLLTGPAIPRSAQKHLLAVADQLVTSLEWKRTGHQVQVSLAKPIRKSAEPVVTAFKPYLPRGDKEEIPLGGEVADVAVGGGGRYLIYQLKSQKKLAVVDVQQGKIVREVPVAEEPVLLAAGARHLAVFQPSQRLLTLWNLDTLQKDRTVPLPAPLAGEPVQQMGMGSASAGPLFFYLPREKRTLALDLARMTTRPVPWKHFGPTGAYGPQNLRVSGDGQVLLGWGGGWAGLEMVKFQDGRPVDGSDKFAFSLGVFAVPSADGRLIFHPDAVVGPDLNAAPAPGGAYLIPAQEPGFFLALKGGNLPFGLPGPPRLPGVNEVTLFSDNRSQLLVLDDLTELKDGSSLHWEKTTHWYPRGGLLVTLADKSKVVLRRLDLVERLNQAGVDYLFVFPQSAAGKRGETLSHRLDIHSKRGGVQVKVVSGPEGLKASPDGQVTWAIPATFPESSAAVLVRIQDTSAQEVLHEFRVTITEE